MIGNLYHLINSFPHLKVLVIGDAMLDAYLEGDSHRLCQEAFAPIVRLSNCQYIPGGAANTAVNVASLGGNVKFLSVIGEDREGAILQEVLREYEVSNEYLLKSPARQTLSKNRVLASGQILVRFDSGSTESIDFATEQQLIANLAELYATCDAVIISDYGYGILTPNVINAIAHLQSCFPRVLVVDSKKLVAYRHVDVTAVKPNYEEAIRLLGICNLRQDTALIPPSRADQISLYEETLLTLTGSQIVAVTLDTEGAIIFDRANLPYRIYAKPLPYNCATGAGDTFTSAIALALASGAITPTAAELASTAASIVVAKDKTATCSLSELKAYTAELQSQKSPLSISNL